MGAIVRYIDSDLGYNRHIVQIPIFNVQISNRVIAFR